MLQLDMDPATRICWLAFRGIEHTYLATKSVVAGMALSFLNREALHQISDHFHWHQAAYHDPNHNNSGLFVWEGRAVEKHFVNCQRLLVTAAGGGRELLALEKLGYQVDGCECQPQLRAWGNEFLAEQGIAARIAPVEPDLTPQPPEEPYDGIIVGWGSYGLIRGRDARIEHLRGLRQQIVAGGPLLVSFWARDSDGGYLAWTHRLARTARRLGAPRKVELGDSLIPAFMHYFTRAEIARELEAGGFELLEYHRYGNAHAIARAA